MPLPSRSTNALPRRFASSLRPASLAFCLSLASALTVIACSGQDPMSLPEEMEPAGDPSLLELSFSEGVLEPAFSPSVTLYRAQVPSFADYAQVTARTKDPRAALKVSGAKTVSGMASSPLELRSGATIITVDVLAPGNVSRQYKLVVTKTIDSQYLKASNTGTDDFFGGHVAMSDDLIAVGAPTEDSKAVGVNGDQDSEGVQDSGAVYIFHRTGDTWTQEAYLKASNPDVDDWFGWRVALSGDLLAVSAVHESSKASGVDGDQDDNGLPSSGAVYIFRRTDTSWVQEAYLKSSSPDENDEFGSHMVMFGDTLAVSSLLESSKATGVNGDDTDNSLQSSGAVYVFRRTNSAWAQEAYLKASNPDVEDFFGIGLALSNDTLAVGADGESSKAKGVDGDQADNSAPLSGAVYVFRRTGSAWTQEAYLKASNSDTNDSFGTSAALSGDLLAVGAYGEASRAKGVAGDQTDNSAPLSGAVYIFRRTGSAWAQEAYLKASNTATEAYFGDPLSFSGNSLAVGSTGESSNATGVNNNRATGTALNSGAVYVFARTGTSWVQRGYFKASNTAEEDSFGYSVVLSGGLMAISAPKEDSQATGLDGDQTDDNAQESGAIYVFSSKGLF